MAGPAASMDWDNHRQTILDIYLTQDKSLGELMQFMKGNHGFVARQVTSHSSNRSQT
jgi:Clr5 domain